MKTITIEVSDEDQAHWERISDKKAWLHAALNRGFWYPELVRVVAVDSEALERRISLKDFVEYCDRLAGSHAKPDYKKGQLNVR